MGRLMEQFREESRPEFAGPLEESRRALADRDRALADSNRRLEETERELRELKLRFVLA